MRAAEEIDRAVEGLYGAVVAPETWPTALEAVSRSLGGSGAVLVPFGQERFEYDYRPSPDFTEAIEAWVHNGWMHNDPRAVRGWPRRKQGVLLEQEISTEEERARHPYYQEWLRPHGLLWWAGVCFEVKDYPWVVSFQRSPRQGPFLADDAQRLRSLVPHFERIVLLAEGTARARNQTRLDMLDHLGLAAFLLDSGGRVIGMSRSAETMLGCDLFLSNNRVVAKNGELDALTKRACSRRAFATGPHRDIATIARQDRLPLAIEAIPLPDSFNDLIPSASAILIVTDPDERARPSGEILRSGFGLTPAEARLAARLAQGENLNTAADALGITYESARTVLKRVFAKVGVSRQSELVALLGRLVLR